MEREVDGMTEKEVKKVVKMTIEELTKQGQLDFGSKAYADIRERLIQYFAEYNDDEIYKALEAVKNDEYYDVILCSFRDLWTVEQIAGYMGRDVRTIMRQKKRLCMQIWKETI